MFEIEYQLSKKNRYRFAWVVATQTPSLSADDVDPAMMLLGRRALDKDWQRRSSLQLDDFLATQGSRRRLGLEAIGFAPRAAPTPATSQSLRELLIQAGSTLEEQVRSYLREQGITASHKANSGRTDLERAIEFAWTVGPGDHPSSYRDFVLIYRLCILDTGTSIISVDASLSATDSSSATKTCSMSLPPAPCAPDSHGVLFTNCAASIAGLAAQLVSIHQGVPA